MAKRIEWVDWVRAIAMIAVVYGHSPCNNSIIEKSLCLYVFSFHVPVFFVLSGFVFSIKDNFGDFIQKKFITLLLPMWIWDISAGFIDWCINREVSIGNFLTSELLKCVFESSEFCHDFWFITALFLTQILAYFQNKYISNVYARLGVPLIVCIVNTVYIFLEYPCLPWYLDIIGYTWLFFTIGFEARKFNIHDKILHMNIYVTTIGIFIINFVCTIVNYVARNEMTDLVHRRIGVFPLFIIGALSAAVFYVVIFTKLSKKGAKFVLLSAIGRSTFLLYIIHGWIFMLFNTIIGKDNLFYGKGLIYTILALVIITPIAILIEKKSPFLAGKGFKRLKNN